MTASFMALMLAMVIPATAFAGGFLTNTNQSASFVRMPSHNARIGVEGVYYNPAGVAFLSDGFHLGFSIQNVSQQRMVTSTFGNFADGMRNDGNSTKEFVGKSYVPVLPSFQLAYNTDKWSVMGAFALIGGGGKCEFESGLGSFEAAASLIPMLGSALGIQSYDMESYMRGRQYYYGFQVGGAYKVTDNLSVSVGGRFTYATCNYYGYIRNIKIGLADGTQAFATDCFAGMHDQAIAAAAQYQAGADQYAAMGMADQAAIYQAYANEYTATAHRMTSLAGATEDVTLNCDQNGFGFTPIIGVDWKINNHWNVAAKYEFKTKMYLENKSSSSPSCDNLEALEQFRDGRKVPEDIPAILTLGVQYSPTEWLRINGGWNYYFDKQATKYNNADELLDYGTSEYMLGVEGDINKYLTLSAGVQLTDYGLTDQYMKDISFTTSSTSLGCGARIHLSEKVAVDFGYFYTGYRHYNRATNDYNNVSNVARVVLGDERVNELLSAQAPDGSSMSPFAGSDRFHRKNHEFAVGIAVSF